MALVGVAVELLRALGLHVRIGSRRLPDAAEIGTALDDGDAVAVAGKRLCRGKPGDAGADHADMSLG